MKRVAALLITLICLGLDSSIQPVSAQSRKETTDLAAFDLRNYPLLKRVTAHTFSAPRAPSSLTQGAQAVKEGRFFHGPSEVRCLVLRFASQQALRDWDGPNRSANWNVGRAPGKPGSTKPVRLRWRPPMTEKQIASSKVYLRRDMQRRNIEVDEPTLDVLTQSRVMSWRSTILADRTIIVVSGSQHHEMIRRGQANAAEMLTDRQMATLVEQVAKELLRRARAQEHRAQHGIDWLGSKGRLTGARTIEPGTYYTPPYSLLTACTRARM